MNKVIKKVIVFSSIAGFVTYSGYNLASNIGSKTPCTIEAEDYEKIKAYSGHIVAHRGLSSQYVENSYMAVKSAFDDPAIGTVEIDIQLTKDNKIVLFHDSKINGLTNGSGEIKDLSLEQLKKVEYYSRSLNDFSELLINLDKNKKEQLIKEGQITNIATFDEILSIDTDKTLLVDIKFDDENAKYLIGELTNKIRGYNGRMNFIFQSTSAKYLKTLREFLPDYPYQIIVSDKKSFEDNYNDFNMFAVKHSVLDTEMIDKISDGNKQLSVWTIKTKKEYEKVRDLACKYTDVQYISDYPDCIGLWINNDLSDSLDGNNKCLVRKR